MTLLDIRIPPRKAGKPRRGRPPVGTAEAKPPLKVTVGRFVLDPLMGKRASMPAFDHPAIVEGRTIYPQSVRRLGDSYVLKSGQHQSKIGGRLLKGRWKGMSVYCLTLEERATCPPDCAMWRAWYGNAMHWAQRWRHGAELEQRLRVEVAMLAKKHASGFAVRLHILGDFYSPEYVQVWRELLDLHPALHVFGFSARWSASDPIARPLIELAMEQWDRFAIRFSNAPIDTCSTITIEHVAQRPADAIVCPAQIGKTESCSTCGLCWQTERRIAFIRH